MPMKKMGPEHPFLYFKPFHHNKNSQSSVLRTDFIEPGNETIEIFYSINTYHIRPPHYAIFDDHSRPLLKNGFMWKHKPIFTVPK